MDPTQQGHSSRLPFPHSPRQYRHLLFYTATTASATIHHHIRFNFHAVHIAALQWSLPHACININSHLDDVVVFLWPAVGFVKLPAHDRPQCAGAGSDRLCVRWSFSWWGTCRRRRRWRREVVLRPCVPQCGTVQLLAWHRVHMHVVTVHHLHVDQVWRLHTDTPRVIAVAGTMPSKPRPRQRHWPTRLKHLPVDLRWDWGISANSWKKLHLTKVALSHDLNKSNLTIHRSGKARM